MIVACSAPGHCMNQCWRFANWAFRNIFQWNSHRIVLFENASGDIIAKFLSLLQSQILMSGTVLAKIHLTRRLQSYTIGLKAQSIYYKLCRKTPSELNHFLCVFLILPGCLKTSHINACANVLSLQGRHNEHNSVPYHRRSDCLLSRLFRCRLKKISKLRVAGLCEGKLPVTDGFPHKGPVTRKCFRLMTSSGLFFKCANMLSNFIKCSWKQTFR